MAMATGLFNTGIEMMANGILNWDGSSNTEAMLTLDSFTPLYESHVFLDDASGSRVNTDDVLAGKSITLDTTGNEVELTCSNITWDGVTGGVVGGFIVFDNTGGTDATDRMFCGNKFTSTVTPNGSDITATINAEGVAKFSYTP